MLAWLRCCLDRTTLAPLDSSLALGMRAREHGAVTSSASIHRRALAGLILATCFWGLSFPTVKGMVLTHEQLLPGSSNWFVTVMILAPRFLLSAVVLFLWAPRTIFGLTRNELRQGTLLALTNALGMLCQ